MIDLKVAGQVNCACGCGGIIRFEDRKKQAPRHWKREKFYLHGHNMLGNHRPKLWVPVVCDCGCGQRLADSHKLARGRRYIPGHLHITEEHKQAVSRAQSTRPRRKWTAEEKIAWAEKQRKIARSGPANHRWKGKGGVDPSKALRRTPEYKAWRSQVFTRDSWTCQICKVKGGRLHPHHIKPVSTHPELTLVLANGRTLCEGCHTELHRRFRPWDVGSAHA